MKPQQRQFSKSCGNSYKVARNFYSSKKLLIPLEAILTLPIFKPRRSCLYTPGANSRAIEKTTSLEVDVVILDLEDAVSPESKFSARQSICEVVNRKIFGTRETVIRINGLDSAWGNDDLKHAIAAAPDAILVPKIRSADDIGKLDSLMSEHCAEPQTNLWVMIEMPEAVLNIASIARTSLTTRLSGFVIGTNDLAKELQAILTPDRQAFTYALSASVLAARVFDLSIIDGVYNDIGNSEGLRAECEHGRILGFDGKTLIHPSQIDLCNQVYSPTDGEINEAEAVIAAYSMPENLDKGVITVNGKMTERLHLEQAKRLVAIAEAIKFAKV